MLAGRRQGRAPAEEQRQGRGRASRRQGRRGGVASVLCRLGRIGTQMLRQFLKDMDDGKSSSSGSETEALL